MFCPKKMVNCSMALIKGTFLDEISHDIPHQNWGRTEWDADFANMKAMGIDMVILIRSGYRRWLTYPSKYLMQHENCYQPPVDLVQLFLELCAKHDMQFYFGLYDTGKYWINGKYKEEIDVNRFVIDEVWQQYGHHPNFKGWYVTQEVSRNEGDIIGVYAQLGKMCKDISGGLPTLISPYIDGRKAVSQYIGNTTKDNAIDVQTHEKDWDEILHGIKGAIDIIAFQDGQVDYDELPDFFSVNKTLADKYGMQCWTNAESFDRDMPIKFLPIKWEKLKLKLEAATRAGIDNAITFEFSHFMSPQSMYGSAKGLYERYQEFRIMNLEL
jgi:Domain of unknown function (DUF5109)/Domain of unknown function (DUF4434)